MATCVKWKWSLLAMLAVALLAGGVVVQVEAGKPKPPPLPVLYGVQLWAMPDAKTTGWMVNKINNWSQVVGQYRTSANEWHAFLYDPNNLSGLGGTPSAALDLNSVGIGIPQGMWIESASDITDNGLIVVACRNNDATYVQYVLNLATRTLAVVPNQQNSAEWGAMRVNDSNQVLVRYTRIDGTTGVYLQNADGTWWDLGINMDAGRYLDLNSHGQVAVGEDDGSNWGVPYRWDPPPPGTPSGIAGTLTRIPGNSTMISAINDSGTVCGRTIYKGHLYPFRYFTNGSFQVLTGQTATLSMINSQGDLLVHLYADMYVYQNSTGLFYYLNNLIDPADPDSPVWLASYTAVSCMNDEDSTGFFQISGGLNYPDGTSGGYLLTPRKP